MNKYNIFIEVIYGFKCTRRNTLFSLFIFISIVGLLIYLFMDSFGTRPINSINDLLHFSMDKTSQALTSSIAYKTAYYFNFVLFFFVIAFIINDSRITKFEAIETLHTRPIDNVEIAIGTFGGKLLAFTFINIIIFIIAILINVAFYPHSFKLSAYFFYWATLNFPTLIYYLSVSYLVNRIVHFQYFSIIIIIAFLGISIYWGAEWLNGLFDPCARYIPNMFSSFTGHVNLENYLLQRGLIILMGGGFLVLSVIPYPRIPNSSFFIKKNLIIACSIFVVAGGVALINNSLHKKKNNRREIYKHVYEEFEEFPSARVIQNDLHVKEIANGKIQVNSKMTIENKASITIPLVIYLNPKLKVNTLDINGKITLFSRNHQVILVDKQLKVGENIEVCINYEGNIENDICFLDTKPEIYHSSTINNIGIYHFGYSPAFCQKRYKLLTPECIWYPVCVPPFGKSGIRDINFSRYSLKVEHDPSLIAISQGNTIQQKQGETEFTFDHDLPGISLCIGNYKKRTIMLDSTLLSLYYLPDHEYILAGYTFPEDKLIQSLSIVKSSLENEECILTFEENTNLSTDPRKQYPYRWLNLLEVPCNFHCFPRNIEPTGERVQAGIVFIPEKTYSIEDYPSTITRNMDFEEVEYMLMKGLGNEIKTIIGEGSCSIRPTLRGKTTYIFSLEYPIINDILNNMARERFQESTSPADDYPAIEYLRNKSLKDAIYDKSLSSRVLENIIRKKSEELYMHITLLTGKEQYRQFYLNFLSDHIYKETTQEEYFRQFYKTLGFRLDSLVENWYNTNKLATLNIWDARAIRILGSGDPYVLYNFKVFNQSDIPGIVATDDYQGWIIPPGEGREIRTYNQKNSIYGPFSIITPLAQNLPAELTIKAEEVEFQDIDTTTGIFKLNSYPANGEEEIIVDNEDPEFRIVKQENFITSLFQKTEYPKEYHTFLSTTKDIWVPMIKEHFYGFPVRSALIKIADSGKQKVEWNFPLLQTGQYEVFFYYTTSLGKADGSLELLYYSIFDGKNEHEVALPVNTDEQGNWISLGVFNCNGNVKVTLSDKGSQENPYQTIVADAVKLVKVKK